MKTKERLLLEYEKYGAEISGKEPSEAQVRAKRKVDDILSDLAPEGWMEFHEWYGDDGNPRWVVEMNRLSELIGHLKREGFEARATQDSSGCPAVVVVA